MDECAMHSVLAELKQLLWTVTLACYQDVTKFHCHISCGYLSRHGNMSWWILEVSKFTKAQILLKS